MDEALLIKYRFEYPDGEATEFEVALELKNLTPLNEIPSPPPWCKLQIARCSNCPLSPEQHPYCPLAKALAPLIGEFTNRTSHDMTTIIVTTSERTISAQTTLQRGLSSLLGLIMATSGCPHTTPFKSMARFHLPFASSEETIYRASANYLLSQYFQQQGEQDWQLHGLVDIYQQLQTVNSGITNRLRQVCEKDAAVNAVVLLDLFAKTIPYSIEETLEEIRHLFV